MRCFPCTHRQFLRLFLATDYRKSCFFRYCLTNFAVFYNNPLTNFACQTCRKKKPPTRFPNYDTIEQLKEIIQQKNEEIDCLYQKQRIFWFENLWQIGEFLNIFFLKIDNFCRFLLQSIGKNLCVLWLIEFCAFLPAADRWISRYFFSVYWLQISSPFFCDQLAKITVFFQDWSMNFTLFFFNLWLTGEFSNIYFVPIGKFYGFFPATNWRKSWFFSHYWLTNFTAFMTIQGQILCFF